MKKKFFAFFLCIWMLGVFSSCWFWGSPDDSFEDEITNERISRVEKTDLKLSEVKDPRFVAFAFMGKMQETDKYTVREEGATKAKKGFISYTQKISATTVKNGDEYYNTSLSNSTFVHSSHAAYFYGDSVICGEENTRMTLEEYRGIYGIAPQDKAIAGYILNDETLVSAEKTGEENGVYTYRFTLSGNAGCENVRRQMKKMGDLSSLPKFRSAELTLEIKDDWTPISIQILAKYDVSIAVLGDMSCTQKLTLTYTQKTDDETERILDTYRKMR